MGKAIDTLMNEHQLILQVIGSLGVYAGYLQQGKTLDRTILAEYVDFFKNFVDRRHHGKEEDLLFKKMVSYGFSEQSGPVAVMLAEHAQGRTMVRALAEITSASGPVSAEEQVKMGQLTRTFSTLLDDHIGKEDRILYPLAVQAIPASEMDQLAAAFQSFEAKVIGAETHERLHQLAQKLIAEYPPFKKPQVQATHPGNRA